MKLNIIKSQIDQSWTISRIIRERPPVNWKQLFEDATPELDHISTVLENKGDPFYPLKQDIFAAFDYTPLNNVKLVIIGQDPYHQTINYDGKSLPKAVGLSFSLRQEDSIACSLRNIYTELENSVKGFKRPDHGDLREWTRQGVLLLNACLTVKPGKPGSHGDIWLGFMNKVFKTISDVNPYCVYLLWGNEAQKLKPMLGNRCIILESYHPSGFSANKGFFGCNHFNKANELLLKYGKSTIDWRISSRAELNMPTKRLETITLPSGNESKLVTINLNNLQFSRLKQCKKPNDKVQEPCEILPIIPNTKPIHINTIDERIILPLKVNNDFKIVESNNIPAIPRIVFSNK